MHILALTRYGSLAPSSRIRFYQYIPYLASCGLNIKVAPLLDDDYIRCLYSRKRPSISSAVVSYFNRIVGLTDRRSFDLLWIEKELFPWLPAWAERVLAGLRVPYVVDYDDAVFHRYDQHRNPMVRALLGEKIDAVMRSASAVVVGNDYLAGRARLAGARRIEYLPSVVDIKRYSIGRNADPRFRIGWIGSPITAPFVGLIREALEEACQKIQARLVLVGAGDQDPLPGIKKEVLPWSENNEVAHIQSFDVGIMPLQDGPFERGKCGYKIIQYMACGLPVVASPVGVNTRIVEHRKTGFLASNSTEWVQALLTLSKDSKMRSDFGKAGRRKAEQEYSLQVTAPRLLEILTNAASR